MLVKLNARRNSMKEFQELVSTQHMSALVVSIKISPLDCSMTYINGPPSLEIVLMRPKSCSLIIVSGLGGRRE